MDALLLALCQTYSTVQEKTDIEKRTIFLSLSQI